MRTDTVEGILAKARDAAIASENLVQFLISLEDSNGGTVIEPRMLVPGRDSSISDIASRIVAMRELLDSTSGEQQRSHLVPIPVLNALDESSGAIVSATSSITKSLKNLERQGGITKFNPNNFSLNVGSGGAHNISAPFQSLFDASESYLDAGFRYLSIVKARGASSFQAAANRFSDLISDIGSTLDKSKSTLKVSDDHLKKLTESLSEANSAKDEIARIKGTVELERKSIAENLAETTQSRSAIQSIRDEARTLEESVKAYQATFEQFAKSQSDREEALRAGNSKLEELTTSLSSKEAEISELLKKSQSMLSTTTIVGLASNFNNMRNDLTKELNTTRWWFFGGIAFLFASSIPLAAFVIMPLILPLLDLTPDRLDIISQLGPNGTRTGWQYFAQVLARTTILLPAVWFVSFMVVRHSSLFRLREHYAYKYSMAAAVEGFKKEAPEYEQEIAAMVLEQLAFNPADKLSHRREQTSSDRSRFAAHLLSRLRGESRTEPS